MNKSKKIIILSLLPGILTLIFIVCYVFPAIQIMSKSHNTLNTEQDAFNKTQSQLNSANQNNKVFEEVKVLRSQLSDFDIKVPKDDELAILLIDLEKFANSFNVKINSFDSRTAKIVNVEDPTLQTQTKKRSRRETVQPQSPVDLTMIPLEINVTGYYSNILDFINVLQHYQRKIVIKDISITDNKEDKNQIRSRIDVSFNCEVYKLTEKNDFNSSEVKL